MCGIAGLLWSGGIHSTEDLERQVRSMANAIAHRGPDDSGVWTDATAGVGLGHRRLSILDLSPLGHQPMVSEDGRWVLTFNGEIYNFQDLRAELEPAGHRFRGGSDTEVLLAAIVEWGIEKALQRCNGMLAIGLWDRETRQLTLARDRLGKKPLYYGWFGGALLFASELKALFRHPRFQWEIDRDALGLFMQYSWIPHPYTIFRNVRKLPPASFLTGGGAAAWLDVHPVSYWSARDVAERGARTPFAGSLEEATEALDVLLRDAVGQRMVADVSLGALLSGGIDSSTVVALMQAMSTRPVKTFCIGFHEAKYNEAKHAAAVAQHLGTDHTELYVTPRDSLDLVPRLPQLYDEPFADSSQIPTFIVSELARKDVTVALTGDGGDEMFAGYSVYPRCQTQWARWRRWPSALRGALAATMRVLSETPWLSDPTEREGNLQVGRKQKLAAKLAKRAGMMAGDTLMEMLAIKRQRMTDPATLVPGAKALPFALTDESRWISLDDHPLQSMQHADIESYLTDDILVKVDRASMGVALEVRCPILDYRVAEFALSLPEGLRRDAGGGKRALRGVLARYVPRALTDRPKAGFGVPVTEWLRGPLRDWAESLLDVRLVRGEGLLDPIAIQRRWRQHLAASHNHEQLLWNVLMFRAWHEYWRGDAAMATSITDRDFEPEAARP